MGGASFLAWQNVLGLDSGDKYTLLKPTKLSPLKGWILVANDLSQIFKKLMSIIFKMQC